MMGISIIKELNAGIFQNNYEMLLFSETSECELADFNFINVM